MLLSLLTGSAPPLPHIPLPPKDPPAIVQKAEVKYKIIKGDTLTRIAKEKSTTVERLFDKNTQLSNPDVLIVGVEITIPEASEKLEPRIPPVAVEKPSQPIGSSSGNAYEPGQCVWFIKNMRPELPNNWGSAVSWLRNAQAQGWPTGSEPRVGAVGWTSGHVVLITAVNPDGTVDIKDMNGRWIPFEIGYGRYSASKYQYIY